MVKRFPGAPGNSFLMSQSNYCVVLNNVLFGFKRNKLDVFGQLGKILLPAFFAMV